MDTCWVELAGKQAVVLRTESIMGLHEWRQRDDRWRATFRFFL